MDQDDDDDDHLMEEEEEDEDDGVKDSAIDGSVVSEPRAQGLVADSD
jgi:hypothetical protein